MKPYEANDGEYTQEFAMVVLHVQTVFFFLFSSPQFLMYFFYLCSSMVIRYLTLQNAASFVFFSLDPTLVRRVRPGGAWPMVRLPFRRRRHRLPVVSA